MNTQFIHLLAEAAHQEEVLEHYLEIEDHEVTSPRESSKTTNPTTVEPEVEEEEFVFFDWPPPRATSLKKNPKKLVWIQASLEGRIFYRLCPRLTFHMNQESIPSNPQETSDVEEDPSFFFPFYHRYQTM